MTSLSTVCDLYIKFVYTLEKQMLVTKSLLTNVTKTNEHSNVTALVRALLASKCKYNKTLQVILFA